MLIFDKELKAVLAAGTFSATPELSTKASPISPQGKPSRPAGRTSHSELGALPLEWGWGRRREL